MFIDLIDLLHQTAIHGFDDSVEKIIAFVDSEPDIIGMITQIGIIPESITHDSTEEKLFAKASDAVLARAFREIGLRATVLEERGNSADVFAQSPLYGYTLVADAKAFRLSRTAKNQKDYKVVALSNWRQDSDYAVLCAPYFQYPAKNSQIYGQAIDHNVCLFSWEHMRFLIENGVKESEQLSFAPLWRYGEDLSSRVLCADKEKCFMPSFDDEVVHTAGMQLDALRESLKADVCAICLRAEFEKAHLNTEKSTIESYSREQAIEELLKAKKINQRIQKIESYIGGLGK